MMNAKVEQFSEPGDVAMDVSQRIAMVRHFAATGELDGVKHFGLWPLSEAATACFGTPEWPSEIPVPQASIEFEVADVAAAAEEHEATGHRLIHKARTEPWKQITARIRRARYRSRLRRSSRGAAMAESRRLRSSRIGPTT